MRSKRYLAGLYAAAFALWTAAANAENQRQPPSQPSVTAITLDLPVAGVTPTITASTSFTSQCIFSNYYRSFTTFAALSGAGTLQVQRYADMGCTYPIGAAVPSTALALTSGGTCPAGTSCGTVASNDGMSFEALKVTVADTSGSTNTVTKILLLLGAE